MAFNFACVNFAKIFIREALISRSFYNRENREIKHELSILTMINSPLTGPPRVFFHRLSGLTLR